MSTSKKKKSRPIIQQNIPANPSITVKAKEFKRSAGSRLKSTTSLSSSSRTPIPLAPQTAHEDADGPTDIQLYSDVEEELLEKPGKKGRERSSRSVSVSTMSPPLPYVSLLVFTQQTDALGRVAPVPGRVHGRVGSVGVFFAVDVSPTLHELYDTSGPLPLHRLFCGVPLVQGMPFTTSPPRALSSFAGKLTSAFI